MHTGVQHNFHFKCCSFRLTILWRVSHIEQKLLILLEHLSLTPLFGIRLAPSLVFCVLFCRSLFVHFPLISSLVSFGHCIVCSSSIYRVDYPLVSFGYCIFCPSSIYRFDHPFCIFWPLYFLSIFNWPFWLPLCYHLATLLSVHLQFTALITPLVSFSHCIVCPSSIYRLITPLVSVGHSIVCPSSIYRFDYPFGIFKLFFIRSSLQLVFKMFTTSPYSE